MGIGRTLKNRYEIREVLGRGGMGVVYKAYDTVLKTDVAVKTIRDAPDPVALELFSRECEVLVKLSHPNIVPILDIGQFDDEGQSKPYFVMPLLPGTTLDNLIKNSASQLTMQRCVDIINQVCRGLHAAHESGLLHRDLKPSNVLVMPDFSVEIIDFGVAHITTTGLTQGQKGTLLYMAPELLQMKQPSVASEVFALGVMTYELLARRRPFERATEQEIAQAILDEIPPPASDLNPAVNQTISRVLHKAMAKQPWHRFASAQEFAETLQKAHRGEPIESFDPSRIQPRIERARKALEQKDYQFALEIIGELEAEGHLDPDLALLRRRVELMQRQKRIQQLLESARIRLGEEEYPLAMQKIQEVLDLEPGNTEALGLKSRIESNRSDRQIEGWIRLAKQHIENKTFNHARQALQNIKEVRPDDSRAAGLTSEVDRLEQEFFRLRKEKEKLYDAAVEAFQIGEVSSALSKLDNLMEVEGRQPDGSAPERSLTYQNFYNQVRSEQDAINASYTEARKHLIENHFAKALALCEQYLQKYPGNALFQALKYDVEEQQRLQLSTYIAEVDQKVDAEADLRRKVDILKEALDRFPDEPHFVRSHRLMGDRLELVEAIVAKARYYEERGQFGEALSQWETLKTINQSYPGLEFEMERVRLRREQVARSEAKSKWLEKIEADARSGEYTLVGELCRSALEEFPDDKELLELDKAAREGKARRAEAEQTCATGRDLLAQGQPDEALSTFRKARKLDERSASIRMALLDCLIERARAELDANWKSADALVQEALELDPTNAVAKSMKALLQDRHREEFLEGCLSEIRQLQAADDTKNALARIEQVLSFYPKEARLVQLHGKLKQASVDAERAETRKKDLEELRGLAKGLEFLKEAEDFRSVWEVSRGIAASYPDDPEILGLQQEFERQLQVAATRQPPTKATEAKPPEAAQPATTPSVPAPAPPAVPPPAPTSPPSPASLPSPAALPSLPSPVATTPPGPSSDEGATVIMAQGAPAAAPPIPPQDKPAPSRPPAGAKREAARPPAAAKPAVAQGTPFMATVRGALSSLQINRKGLLVAGGVAVVALAAAGILYTVLGTREPIAENVLLEVRATPADATIFLDDQVQSLTDSKLSLPPGEYQLRIVKDGYRMEEITVNIVPGQQPSPVVVSLAQAAQNLQILTDLKEGKVWLDDAPSPDLPPTGQLSLEGLSPGKHSVRIESGRSRAVFEFEIVPAARPLIQKPKVVGGLDAIIVSSFKDVIRLDSTFSDPGRLDGRDAQALESGEKEWRGLSQGAHELAFGSGQREWKAGVDTGNQPRLVAFLSSGANVGTLVVEVSGSADAEVMINGKRQGRTSAGRLQLMLEPGKYTVQVAKEGFQNTEPQERTVRRRSLTRLPFTLVPVPAAQPAPVPAEKPAPSQPTLLTGVLRVQVTPRSAEVTFMKSGESSPRTYQGQSMDLPEGSYTVTARAAGHTDKSETVQVSASSPQTVRIALSPAAAKVKAPEPRLMQAGDWNKAWTQESEWYTRRGGDFVLYNVKPALGNLEFTIRIRETSNPFSNPKGRWILNYKDSRNYTLFEVDKDSYSCTDYRNGRKNERIKDKRHGVTKPIFAFHLVVESKRFVLRYQSGGTEYKVIDEWTAPDHDFGEGHFGFYLPGNDQIWLAHFSFLASQ